MVAADQLRKIMPNCSFLRITAFAPWLNKTMDEFHINSEPRITAFLAQIAHESCELRYVEEIASGRAYEGRKDMGNLHHGDGVKYKGRGLMQITGRANYAACGHALGLDLINHPELLCQIPNACRSAGWFWADYKKLNPLADMLAFETITRRINGGLNGYAERLAYYETAQEVIA
jgi:putative chitinase